MITYEALLALLSLIVEIGKLFLEAGTLLVAIIALVINHNEKK